MGTYTTLTTLDLLAPDHQINTSTGNANTRATQCITMAESRINSALSRRFDVSAWSTAALTPPIIKTIADTLSLGLFFRSVSRGGKESLDRSKALIDEANEMLKSLAERAMDLADSSGAIVSERSTTRVRSTTEDYIPTFAEDSETQWAVDQDKLDDIADDRE